jgi:hypothetical protein
MGRFDCILKGDHSNTTIISLRMISLYKYIYLMKKRKFANIADFSLKLISLYTAGNRHKQNNWFCKEIPVLVEESSRRRFARYVHVKNLNFLFYCSNIAKSENAMLWRMLSRLETCIVYSCI